MKQRCLPVIEIELIAFKCKPEYDSMTIITAAIRDKFPNQAKESTICRNKGQRSCETRLCSMLRSLNGILPGPFTSCGFVPRTVGFVNMSNLRYQRIIRVGVREHGANRQEDF